MFSYKFKILVDLAKINISSYILHFNMTRENLTTSDFIFLLDQYNKKDFPFLCGNKNLYWKVSSGVHKAISYNILP